jgi:hypothetical protein
MGVSTVLVRVVAVMAMMVAFVAAIAIAKQRPSLEDLRQRLVRLRPSREGEGQDADGDVASA